MLKETKRKVKGKVKVLSSSALSELKAKKWSFKHIYILEFLSGFLFPRISFHSEGLG